MATPTRIPLTERPNALAAPADSPLAHVVETSSAAAAQMARTNVEARFQVALYRPRDWGKVRQSVMDACKRARFAEEARYKVPRGKEQIEGLSIRFAEEALRALGNAMVESMVTFDDAERRIVRVTVTDLEGNVTWPFDVVVEKVVERSTTRAGQEVVGDRQNSQGKRVFLIRASDEEVFNKQNQLVSKAARNGILRFIPADLQEDALKAIQDTLTTAARDGETLARLVEFFGKYQVTRANLEGLLGHPMEQITGEEYSVLRGYAAALRDGETSWQQIQTEYKAPVETQRRQRKPGPEHVRQGDVGYGGEPQTAAAPQPPAQRKTREQIRQEAAEHGYPPEDTEPLPHQAAAMAARAAGNGPQSPPEAPAAAEATPGGPEPTEAQSKPEEWICGQCGVDTIGEVCENCGAPKGAGDAAGG